MSDICPRCGLPKDLCICSELDKEVNQILVETERARFNKMTTIISGVPKDDLKRVAKYLKRHLACGGSSKDGKIILQGDHRGRVKKFLVELGYSEENITIL